MSKRAPAPAGRRAARRGWDDPRMPTLAACAAAASRPRRSAGSASASASRKRRQRRSTGAARACVRERSEPDARRAAWRCCDPLKVVIENYPEGQVEKIEASTTRRIPPTARARAVRARAVHRARRLHRGPAAEVLPPGARAARCGCATPTSSAARGRSRTPTARSSSCAAPTTRRPAAATRPMAAR